MARDSTSMMDATGRRVSGKLVHVLAAVALACLLSASAAAAQGSDAEQSALARSLFQEALELAEAGEWEEAVDRYRRVLQLRRTPQIMFNLAEALAELGLVVEATELLHQAARDESANRRIRRAAAEALERVEPRIGRLTIMLTGHAEGTIVTLDREPVAAAGLGVAAPVDPGHHVIAVLRDEHEIASEEVDVADGASATLTLDVPAPVPTPEEVAAANTPETAPDLTASDEPTSGGGGVEEEWWFWTLLAVLVIGGGVATVLILTVGDVGEDLQGDFMPGRIGFGP